MVTRVLIMAGGTGGHVFPALAVAEQLRAAGAEILWLGTRRGLEAEVVPRAGFPLAAVSIGGLRGTGLRGWAALPFRLVVALLQSLFIILRFRPMVVLGMGGFVSGPGGLMTWLLHKPLLIHEQNAVAGMTNRWLARLAARCLTAFPDTLPQRLHPVLTGNPVRREIAGLPPPEVRFGGRSGPLRLLVLGGSQGAHALNVALPDAVGALGPGRQLEIWHQTGRREAEAVQRRYAEAGIAARVETFIEDMAAAYAWADLVVCRAGALTVAELAAAGVAAVLVPYPHAVDDHQTRNAAHLVDAGAAVLLAEDERLAARLAALLADFAGEALAAPPGRRGTRLLDMACAARRQARPEAVRQVTQICMELAHG